MPSSALTTIAITAGDPCGIGPEVILKALARTRPSGRRTRLIIIGDHRVFAQTATRLHQRMPPWRCLDVTQTHHPWLNGVTFLDCGHASTFAPGRSSGAAGVAARAYLDRALRLWHERRIDALVTAPVTKWAMERSLPRFVGQTEYLAEHLGVRDVAMMFVSDRLRVVLFTRHVALSRVASAVDRRLIRTTVRLTHDVLRTGFQIRQPRLAFCGLNPHAGEGGLFGREEQRTLLPALSTLRRRGVHCAGPFAADGFFAQPQAYDAIFCWYHDQGLIPFKMAARDYGCQLSLGLPLIRTSPDHGSALEIAGRGVAHPGSMVYAIHLAATLLRRSRRS